MAQAAAESLNYPSLPTGAKPPLDMGVRVRLSVMMFLQFAVWGSFWTVLNVYCDKTLNYSKVQIGSLYGTMALGAILSTMFAGQLADRVMSSEYLMAIFHLGGAALLFGMAMVHDFTAMWWLALGYALLYNPTLAISNSLAFHNIPDATRDFPSLRVLGTVGWIVAGLSVDFFLGAGAAASNKPLLMASVLSAALGLFSLSLPHTPPSGKKGELFPFLRAFGLLKDYSFGVFFIVSFAITIALAFYYTFTGNFLTDLGVGQGASHQTVIQTAALVVMLLLPILRGFDVLNDLFFTILFGIAFGTTVVLFARYGMGGAASVQTFGQMSEIFFLVMLPFALKKWGMKGVLCVGMCAWAARYGLFSLGHPFALVLIGVILHGVCFDFFLAAGFIHTDNKAPADIRGSAQALFTFLTYGVGMFIGNVISGYVVQAFTTPDKITHWSKVWLVPAVGATICLVAFLLLWRDTGGKVNEVDPIAETAASPGSPDEVSQTIA